jgi:hypothetical protein
MFDAYFDWTQINTKPPSELKKILTGMDTFTPDKLSDTLFNMLENLELNKSLDYGAGLGRNVTLLKRIAKDVDYIDLMQYKDVIIFIENKELYDKFFFIEDPTKDLILEDNYDIVYASVIFQHIIDVEILKKIFRALSQHTKYLLTIQNSYVDRLDHLLENDFNVVYQEIDNCGFTIPHIIQLWENQKHDNSTFQNLNDQGEYYEDNENNENNL